MRELHAEFNLFLDCFEKVAALFSKHNELYPTFHFFFFCCLNLRELHAEVQLLLDFVEKVAALFSKHNEFIYTISFLFLLFFVELA